MNEFLFLYRGGRAGGTRPSAEDMKAMMQRYEAWFAKLSEEGRIKDMGAKLGMEGRVIGSGGLVTDGPFSEGKEVIGGYMIIRAKDLDEATAIAKESPMAETEGAILEIRPISPM